MSKVANKSTVAVKVLGDESTVALAWYNPLGGVNRIEREVDISSGPDIMRALHESQFVTRKVSINRGTAVLAIVAFAIEGTDHLYLATFPNPIEITQPQPKSPPFPAFFTLSVQGEEFSAFRSGRFAILQGNWQTFKVVKAPSPIAVLQASAEA